MISEFESSSKVVERLARGKHYETAHFTQQDSELEKVCHSIDLIRDAAFLYAGFHTHNRQWRKKRDDGSNRRTDQRKSRSDSDQIPMPPREGNKSISQSEIAAALKCNRPRVDLAQVWRGDGFWFSPLFLFAN